MRIIPPTKNDCRFKTWAFVLSLVLHFSCFGDSKQRELPSPLRSKNGESKSASSFILNWAQLGGGVFFDSDGGLVGAMALFWNPTWLLNRNLRVKNNLGVLAVNFGAGAPILLGELSSALELLSNHPITFELGGGIQYWKSRGGVHPIMKLGMGYRLSGSGGLIHSINLTYQNLPSSKVTVHQILAGLSFRFM